MNELQYKIEVETRIKEGAAKLLETPQLGDKKKTVEASLQFSKAKINLLKSSLKNYESLLITNIKSDKDQGKLPKDYL